MLKLIKTVPVLIQGKAIVTIDSRKSNVLAQVYKKFMS